MSLAKLRKSAAECEAQLWQTNSSIWATKAFPCVEHTNDNTHIYNNLTETTNSILGAHLIEHCCNGKFTIYPESKLGSRAKLSCPLNRGISELRHALPKGNFYAVKVMLWTSSPTGMGIIWPFSFPRLRTF